MKIYIKGFFALFLSAPVLVALGGTPMQKGYYIVVAAYRVNQEAFAEKYAAELNRAGHHAQTGFDAARHYHYVYLDYFTDFDESVNKMLEVRKQAGFAEAWVRVIKDGTEPEVVQQAPIAQPPVSAPKEATQNNTTQKEKEQPAEKLPEPIQPAAPPALQPKPEPEQTNGKEPKAEAATVDSLHEVLTLQNTRAFLSLYNATNNELIDGEVEVVDAERSRLILKTKGNEYMILPDPKSKSGKLLLIGSSFGFRKIQHEMHYSDTEKDTLQPDITLEGDYYLVRFEMARLHKGDIAVLYNVYFYNDAAIMLPESKYELNKLLSMMQENPKYRITLHGHTNGHGRGKIIRTGPSKDFFNLHASDVVNENVSAKELSGARAQVIKDWLVARGLSADRIEVKAWGGTRMLHDKNGQHARRNVRVEVEVTEE